VGSRIFGIIFFYLLFLCLQNILSEILELKLINWYVVLCCDFPLVSKLATYYIFKIIYEIFTLKNVQDYNLIKILKTTFNNVLCIMIASCYLWRKLMTIHKSLITLITQDYNEYHDLSLVLFCINHVIWGGCLLSWNWWNGWVSLIHCLNFSYCINERSYLL
jgi:hypothetical protein